MKKTEEINLKFFRIVKCENCNCVVPYRKLLGRPPVFHETCEDCGEKLKLVNGARAIIYWVGVLVLCCLFDAWLLERINRMLPIFVYTMFLVIGALCVAPFTLDCVCKKKKKKRRY